LQRSGVAALAATGLYGLVDELAAAPARASASILGRPAEQHLLRNVAVLEENGVEVVVPPLHHQIVTAKLEAEGGRRELRDAQRALEQALARLDATYPPTPSGLGLTIGWSRPYFREHLRRLADGRRFRVTFPSTAAHHAQRAKRNPRCSTVCASRAIPTTFGAEEQGMNSVRRTTHRQNFLVPPRRSRSFPLVELL
jgi:hypothetical protein